MLFCPVPVVCSSWSGPAGCPAIGVLGMDEAVPRYGLVHEPIDPDYSVLPGDDSYSTLVEAVRQAFPEHPVYEELDRELLDPKKRRRGSRTGL